MWSTCFPKAVVAFLMDRGCSCRTIVQHCATNLNVWRQRQFVKYDIEVLNQKSSKFTCKDLVARADLNGKAGKIASWAFPPLFEQIRATHEAKSHKEPEAKKLKRPWPVLLLFTTVQSELGGMMRLPATLSYMVDGIDKTWQDSAHHVDPYGS